MNGCQVIFRKTLLLPNNMFLWFYKKLILAHPSMKPSTNIGSRLYLNNHCCGHLPKTFQNPHRFFPVRSSGTCSPMFLLQKCGADWEPLACKIRDVKVVLQHIAALAMKCCVSGGRSLPWAPTAVAAWEWETCRAALNPAESTTCAERRFCPSAMAQDHMWPLSLQVLKDKQFIISGGIEMFSNTIRFPKLRNC